MNYNFLSQLLDNGISEEELIASLSKSVPRLAKQAKKMFFGGWSPKDVLNMFSKDKEAQKAARKGLKPVTPAEMASMHLQNSYNNIPQSQSQESLEKMKEFTKQAAPYALGYVGSKIATPIAEAALSRVLPQVGGLAKNVIPQAVEKQLQGMAQGEQPLDQLNNVNTQQPPANQIAVNIPEPINIQQPKVISNPKEYLEKKGVLNDVIDSLKKGNNPLQVATQLGIKKTGHAKIDPELLKNIEEFSALPQEETESQNLLKPTELVEKPIEKSSIVASPQGLGTVKEIRNGKVLVEIDGEKHQIDEDELIQSPLPEKDLADLYDDLIKGIEEEIEEDVSRMVQWAGYNPETNSLTFLPHSGDLYTYDDISEEDAALLRDILSVRKTSGENFIGAWKQGSKSPIGAAMSKLIRKLQSERGGKGKEYSEKHPTLYSAYEPAIKAKKKKKKK